MTDPSSSRSSSPLAGKVAFIAGGTGVLGEAIARGLARAGAQVAVGGPEDDRLREVTESLAKTGAEARAVPFDARSVKDIGRAVDGVCDSFGRCDILVNSVGIHREQLLLEATEESYDSVIALNLKAAMFLGQAVARRQVQTAQGGKQVHLLSVRAKLALQGKGYSSYTSSKGGLAMLVKQHAVELAQYRINVNGVAPTFVNSEMAQHMLKDAAAANKLLERIPMGRIAEPEDVVGPTLFLCGPGSEFITGQILYVDGGLTACQ